MQDKQDATEPQPQPHDAPAEALHGYPSDMLADELTRRVRDDLTATPIRLLLHRLVDAQVISADTYARAIAEVQQFVHDRATSIPVQAEPSMDEGWES